MKTEARSNEPMKYSSNPTRSKEDATIAKALSILESRMHQGPIMNSPEIVKQYLCMRTTHSEREEFSCVFLTAQHQVISTICLFQGTLSQASVYPREVVKTALALNAGALILTHNHPSGMVQPSEADKHLTRTLVQALALVDIRVLDHVITAGSKSFSFAESGLM